jgi:hypothetical protein
MTNRIGGDFNQDAVEAFRAAYAQILNAPEDDSVANDSGLPTDTVANTSPWHDHMPLWKYPSGKGPEDDLRAPFNPDDYVNEVDEDDEQLSEGEIETLLNELLNQTEAEEEEETTLSDEDLERLVDQLLTEDEEED